MGEEQHREKRSEEERDGCQLRCDQTPRSPAPRSTAAAPSGPQPTCALKWPLTAVEEEDGDQQTRATLAGFALRRSQETSQKKRVASHHAQCTEKTNTQKRSETGVVRIGHLQFPSGQRPGRSVSQLLVSSRTWMMDTFLSCSLRKSATSLQKKKGKNRRRRKTERRDKTRERCSTVVHHRAMPVAWRVLPRARARALSSGRARGPGGAGRGVRRRKCVTDLQKKGMSSNAGTLWSSKGKCNTRLWNLAWSYWRSEHRLYTWTHSEATDEGRRGDATTATTRVS